MSLRVPDAALRALIIELAALHPDDVAAILAGLSDEERQVVESCLDGHMSRFEVAPAAGTGVPFDAMRISFWLSSRLQPPVTGGDPMTPQARQALLACAIRLYPAESQAA